MKVKLFDYLQTLTVKQYWVVCLKAFLILWCCALLTDLKILQQHRFLSPVRWWGKKFFSYAVMRKSKNMVV